MWNIKELKCYLKLIGKSPENYIEYLDSVSRVIDIFEFHKIEAFKVINTLDTVDPENAMRLVFLIDSEKNDLEYKVIYAQAHLQAALQNVRSMYDILAQLLNAILLNNELAVYSCDIARVCKKLPNGNVRDELENILDSFEYQYVSSFVNTIKHRNLVQFNRQLDFLESRASIRIKAYSYSGKYYEQKWAIDVLKYGLELKNKLIEIGMLLNSGYEVGST